MSEEPWEDVIRNGVCLLIVVAIFIAMTSVR